MRRLVISDSHGGYKALLQCLERSDFDKEKDQLVFLGDVVDGWSQTKESIELLLTLKHLVYLLGNHDQWALEFYTGQLEERELELVSWLSQGGAATVMSYGRGNQMPPEHLALLQNAKLFYLTEDNILFVHAGFDTSKSIEKNSSRTLLWDRDFIEHYFSLYKQHTPIQIDKYKEVFIGHTPTILLAPGQTQPLQMGNIMLVDTGAAFTGSLSILDIDSREVWQSDKVMTLYPDEEGRNQLSWNVRKSQRKV